MSENGGFGRGKDGEDKEVCTWCEGNWKVFEKLSEIQPYLCKTRIFHDSYDSRASHQNPLCKILKNFSKTFSRLGLPIASESRTSLSNFTTGLPLTKMSHQNDKNPEILKNFLSIFHDWRSYLLGSHETFCVNSRPRDLHDSWVNRQKTELKIFLFLWKILKQNTFQKQLKYSKIFLYLINICLSMYNTFNQVQSHKWIRHSLNIDMCDVGGFQMWDSP